MLIALLVKGSETRPCEPRLRHCAGEAFLVDSFILSHLPNGSGEGSRRTTSEHGLLCQPDPVRLNGQARSKQRAILPSPRPGVSVHHQGTAAGGLCRLTQPGENAMLVLTRRRGEEIVLSGGIRITVLRVQGNRVRIGITAPENVAVYRQELVERLQGESDQTDAPLPTLVEPALCK
jgi:carbon storage regulator